MLYKRTIQFSKELLFLTYSNLEPNLQYLLIFIVSCNGYFLATVSHIFVLNSFISWFWRKSFIYCYRWEKEVHYNYSCKSWPPDTIELSWRIEGPCAMGNSGEVCEVIILILGTCLEGQITISEILVHLSWFQIGSATQSVWHGG